MFQQDDDEGKIWGITPEGRALFQQIMRALSEAVGRNITNDELGVALRRLRQETGLVDPPFSDPRNYELLLEFLREPEEEA